MALNIKSGETDRLVRELTALTGEGITEAVTKALAQRLERERRMRNVHSEALKAELRAIAERAVRLPVLDPRSDDEILGYNEFGAFD